jgi:beta-lactam-binding protein with PASTA domain
MGSPFRRIAAIVALCFLTTAAFSFASGRPLAALIVKRPVVERPLLVVPRVEGQAYVFAKGLLEDEGFAWRVPARNGFAANTVVAQSPAPGTRVRDTGAPLVTLTLAPNRAYPERGKPDNRAPYRGTALLPAKARRSS